MAIDFDFPKNYYDNLLMSHHGTDATWIDESDVESPIRIMIRRTPFQGTSKNFNKSLYNVRRIYISVANSDLYGRTNVKPNKEKVRFKEDVTNNVEKTFLIANIVRSDKSKIVMSLA